jgi:hypothetical protein
MRRAFRTNKYNFKKKKKKSLITEFSSLDGVCHACIPMCMMDSSGPSHISMRNWTNPWKPVYKNHMKYNQQIQFLREYLCCFFYSSNQSDRVTARWLLVVVFFSLTNRSGRVTTLGAFPQRFQRWILRRNHVLNISQLWSKPWAVLNFNNTCCLLRLFSCYRKMYYATV